MQKHNKKLNIMNSKKFRLNLRESINGFVIAAVGAVLGGAIDMLQNGAIDYKSLLLGGLIAGLSYLKVTFFQDNK